MKVLSLFDGISCGMVALERAGITVDAYFASEIGVKRVTENEEEGGRKGMTREEAIWRLENCLECTDCFTCGSHDTALVMAVAALREQEVASDVITRSLTNADRIRAMSDEELAMWLTNFFWGRKEEVRLFKLREWLQEPVKEDA